MMQLDTKELGTKSIDSRSRSLYYRHKLQVEKKKDKWKALGNISMIEEHLAELGKQQLESANVTQVIIGRMKYTHQHQASFISFYHESNWAKKAKNGSPRFKEKAYATTARLLVIPVVNTTKLVPPTSCHVYYGDAGQGFGSRIKGHAKRSTTTLQQHMEGRCHLTETAEYLSSKLRCLCDSPVMHPRRRNKRINSGVFMCINPDCIGRRYGFSL